MPDVKFSNLYPYTDFHELNLDWVIKEVKYWSTKVGKTIQSITLTGTVGLVDTYTITYTDGTTSTFNVTNGNGITSVAKTGTAGLVDTYTITFQDGSSTTFDVTNGAAAVDPTLTLSDYAADAKVVGDRALLGKTAITNASQIVAPYNDFNTFPKNSIISFVYGITTEVANKPADFSSGTVITFDYNVGETIGVQAQLVIPNSDTLNIAYRNNWAGTWKSWRYTQSAANVNTAINTALAAYSPTSVTERAVRGTTLLFANTPSAPYNDMDTVPENTIFAMATAGGTISHGPSGFNAGTVITLSYKVSGNLVAVQLVFYSTSNEIYMRSKFASSWTGWRKLTISTSDLVNDATFSSAVSNVSLGREPFSMSTFENIGVIGDSYASGLIVDADVPINVNKYNLSWIQVMARHFGITATNYSFNGATIRSWMNDTTHPGYNFTSLLAGDPLDLYYICMGINESSSPADVGTIADINPDYHDNPDTFYGNMGRVIDQIASHAPDGKIILCTTPVSGNTVINAAIEEIATHYGIGFIKTLDDSFFSSSYYTNFLTNHPTAPGYSGYAMAYARLTYKAIANNVSYFKYFVGET